MPADLQDARVRPPAVAGLFYPRDPVRLQTEVLELVGGGAPHSKVIPKALIAPHAGYVYPRPGRRRSICEASGERPNDHSRRVDRPDTTFIWVGLLLPGRLPV